MVKRRTTMKTRKEVVEKIVTIKERYKEPTPKYVYEGDPRIIFGVDEGTVLQVPGYSHCYDDYGDLAEAIHTYMEDWDTSKWDGNQSEMCFEPSAVHTVIYFDDTRDLLHELLESEVDDWQSLVVDLVRKVK
jgi:hypothetical protein